MHPLSEDLRETAAQQHARTDLFLTAADELDRLSTELEEANAVNARLHHQNELLVVHWEKTTNPYLTGEDR